MHRPCSRGHPFGGRSDTPRTVTERGDVGFHRNVEQLSRVDVDAGSAPVEDPAIAVGCFLPDLAEAAPVVLSTSAANALDVTAADGGRSITVDGRAFILVGVFDEATGLQHGRHRPRAAGAVRRRGLIGLVVGIALSAVVFSIAVGSSSASSRLVRRLQPVDALRFEQVRISTDGPRCPTVVARGDAAPSGGGR